MKLLLSMFICLAIGAIMAPGGVTNAPAIIKLADQFDRPQILEFPKTTLTVLTIADRKGSKQIAGWVEPVARQFGTSVDIRGIADLSAVPGLLRGTVKSAFRREQSYPVMLDWSGEVVRKFDPKADLVNVFLLNQKGRVLQCWSGAVTAADSQRLLQLIKQHGPATNGPARSQP